MWKVLAFFIAITAADEEKGFGNNLPVLSISFMETKGLGCSLDSQKMFGFGFVEPKDLEVYFQIVFGLVDEFTMPIVQEIPHVIAHADGVLTFRRNRTDILAMFNQQAIGRISCSGSDVI